MIMLILRFLGACFVIYLGFIAIIWTCFGIFKALTFEFKPAETEDERRKKLGY